MADEDLGKAKQTADELSGMMKKNNFKGVLTYIGKNPPNCKDADLHKQIGESVLDALRSIKKDQAQLLDEIEEHEREVLLKYVYYGFQAKPEFATEYTTWHQAIVKKDGLGAIVRVLTDIKRNILVVAAPGGKDAEAEELKGDED